ncbi:hypothetical protein [Limnoglobus roseus]|uniref:Uncharacterized protein n=1 Tax=Limnoglobus roseus TaxID=2598579 RepID=A0A5C1AJN0_9BACT|nr:hypothetical protein [Limnoglobus roseus]QEL18387.1 hypothetical protein PX52LOC_05411 [Limnoglobus roseus]
MKAAAAVLGATARRDGYFEDAGHLVTLKKPHDTNRPSSGSPSPRSRSCRSGSRLNLIDKSGPPRSSRSSSGFCSRLALVATGAGHEGKPATGYGSTR